MTKRAENVTGLKLSTEDANFLRPCVGGSGRGAFLAAVKSFREKRWSARKRECWYE